MNVNKAKMMISNEKIERLGKKGSFLVHFVEKVKTVIPSSTSFASIGN